MRKVSNISGQSFGNLTVIKRVESHDNRARWLCQCSCGKSIVTSTQGLRRKTKPTRSCGCLRGESHGMWNTPEYVSWQMLKDRCNNPNNNKYAIYGGRGIKVCDRWQESFISFYEDMGNKPSTAYSIDRINSNDDYSPQNCRWATITEQNSNTRRTRKVTIDGKTMCATEWAKYLGIKPHQIFYLTSRKGMTHKEAVKQLM